MRARFRGLTLTDGTPKRRARINRLSITTTTAVVKARFRGLSLIGTSRAPKARFSRLSLFGTQPGSRARFRGLSMYGGALGAVSANAGGGRFVEPLSTVVLDGTASSGNPTGYTWTQVSNGAPTVTIVGSGPIVAFQAPGTENGVDLVFQLEVTLGPSSDTDEASITVRPQLFWYLSEDGSDWLPVGHATV